MGNLENLANLKVIAQVQQDTILEYVAYKGIKNIRPSEKTNDNMEISGKINTYVYVVKTIILLALITGLAVVIYIFQQRNKSLLNQVKNTIFFSNKIQ